MCAEAMGWEGTEWLGSKEESGSTLSVQALTDIPMVT